MQRIHIFKAGKQTSSNGTTIVFSEADVEATASAYNPALHEAPIVIGHPEQEDPAFGWISQLEAQAGNLYATPSQVNADFAELVQAGAYKKVSASFYPPEHPNNPTPGVYALRHVGFLGAQPPAVKGLKATQFADAAGADATQPLVELELDFAEVSPTDPTPINPPTPELENTVTPEQAAALQASNDALAAQLAAAQTSLQAQAATANTATHAAFAEALINSAKVPVACKPFLVAAMDYFEPPVVAGESVDVVSFGEGDGKKTLVQGFKDFLEALPQAAAAGQQAGRERAAEGGQGNEGAADTVTYAEGTPADQIQLDKSIRAFAKEHKLSYVEAAGQVAARGVKPTV